MAVGDGTLPTLWPVPGVRLGIGSAGIKKPGKRDLTVIEVAPDTQAAATFTRNAFCAAPVQLAKQHLAATAPRYLLINTGNANAGTGQDGLNAAINTCQALAKTTEVTTEAVLPFSTGVIGELLPAEKVITGLPAALADLAADHWAEAASAIMTTDTRPKGASVQFDLEGVPATVTGIAKGAGMIRPNMATMLAFIATDLHIAEPLLQKLNRECVEYSFNRITVDGDMSTNDACVLLATGQHTGTEISDVSDPRYAQVRDQLLPLYQSLAQAIVRDGEGATKFVAVKVVGGRDPAECLQVAYAIAHSPLIKTALFACDPNWGRILAAVGYAGIDALDVTQVSVYLDDVLIAEHGARAASYTEAAGKAVMDRGAITITVDLGRGSAQETVWTTDLSHDYVTINAEYRT